MNRLVFSALLAVASVTACATSDGDGKPLPVKITCPYGFAECTGSKTCDTDLRASSDHCGICNHACGGADCAQGWCDTVVITAAPERSPSGLAAIPGVGAVWVTNGGATLRKWDALNDVVSTLLTVTPAPTVTAKTVRTIVDETHVYWLNPEEGVLRRSSLDAPAAEVVVASGVRFFALRGGDFVWIDADGKLNARAKTGGDVRPLATGLVAPTELAASHSTIGYIDGTTLVRFKGDDHAGAVRWSPPGDPVPVPYAVKLAEAQGLDGAWYDKTGWVAWDLPDGRAHLGQCAILGSCGTKDEGWTWTFGRPSPLLLNDDGGTASSRDSGPTYQASYTLVRKTATDALGQLVRWPFTSWPTPGIGGAGLVAGVVASEVALDATHVYLLNGATGQVSRIVR